MEGTGILAQTRGTTPVNILIVSIVFFLFPSVGLSSTKGWYIGLDLVGSNIEGKYTSHLEDASSSIIDPYPEEDNAHKLYTGINKGIYDIQFGYMYQQAQTEFLYQTDCDGDGFSEYRDGVGDLAVDALYLEGMMSYQIWDWLSIEGGIGIWPWQSDEEIIIKSSAGCSRSVFRNKNEGLSPFYEFGLRTDITNNLSGTFKFGKYAFEDTFFEEKINTNSINLGIVWYFSDPVEAEEDQSEETDNNDRSYRRRGL